MTTDVSTTTDTPSTRPIHAKELGERFLPSHPRAAIVRSLFQLMSSKDMVGDEWERAYWCDAFGQWVHSGPIVPTLPAASAAVDPRTARLKFFVVVMDGVPEWRGRFAGLLGPLLAGSQSARLFADAGLPAEPGFVRELFNRIAQRVLPSRGDPRKLSALLLRWFRTEDDATWLATARRDVLYDVIGLMFESDAQRATAIRHLRVAMIEAVAMLAARVSGLGLAPEIGERLADGPVFALPFVRLPRACDALALDPGGDRSTASDLALCSARSVLDECRQAVATVLDHLEQSGVSVDLVFRLELITAQLQRLEELVAILVPEFSTSTTVDLPQFFSAITEGERERRSIRSLFRQNSGRLARKIIERAGHSGDHYITATRREWYAMLASAGGGGVLMAGTATMKFLALSVRSSPFVGGLLSSLNYAGSFLAMQLCGFTLATKQPSVTAAALARSLEDNSAPRTVGGSRVRRIECLVEMIARITRSQFAAAIGNISMVIPATLGVDRVWQMRTGHHVVDHQQAQQVVESLHLYQSGTIAYGALGGVFLWSASIAAGWLENWAVYNKLPQAIEFNHRLVRTVGRRGAARLSRWFAHGISGFGGNLTLGLLLGLAPVFGTFFGLPIDVRHVTLSTGALTLAGASLGTHAVLHAAFAWAIAGVAVIGLLNFGVSFVLALSVALSARGVPRGEVRFLVRMTLSLFFRRPWEFLYPPKRAG